MRYAGIVVACTLALMAGGSVFADDNKPILIKGTVIDDNGKPCHGAEIRALRVDGKRVEAKAVTDAHGHYMIYGLPAGAYSVTAYLDGFARSRAVIKTHGASWAKVDFDLGLDQDNGDGVDRMQKDLRKPMLRDKR